MRMDPETEAAVERAIEAVHDAALSATMAHDLAAVKLALNHVWFAVNKAQTVVTDAENATRRAALAKLEKAA